MDRPDDSILHAWHIAINKFCFGDGSAHSKDYQGWMYDAKQIADEVPRMAILFELERTCKLPVIHQQCSHQRPEKIVDNHLTCCLGVECRACPYLKALDQAKATPERIDEIKAWTCAAHVMSEKAQQHIDTSEGYILTVGDQMFWQRTYSSLARGDNG